MKSKDKYILYIAVLVLFCPFFFNSVTDNQNISTLYFFIVDFSLIVIVVLYFQYSFILILSVFLFLFYFQSTTLFQFVNAIRDFFPLLILPLLFTSINQITIKNLDKLFILFLIVQIPVTIIQLVAKGYAGDWVVGTLGHGSSGVLSLIIFLLVDYFINEKDNISKINWMYLFFLFPTMINETKISFVLLLILLFKTAYKHVRISMKTIIQISFLFMLLFFTVIHFYENTTEQEVTKIFSVNSLDSYFYGDPTKSQWSLRQFDWDMGRFMKMLYLYDVLDNNAQRYFFGIDLSAFRGSSLGESNFASSYWWLLKGSRPYLFNLIIQGGIILVLFLTYFVYTNLLKNNKNKYFFSLLAILVLLYNEAFRFSSFSFVYIYLSLLYSREENN